MSAFSRWLPSVPLLDWGRQYNRETFTSDAVAALIVTIIPVALLIALFQERVIGGLTQGGLKG